MALAPSTPENVLNDVLDGVLEGSSVVNLAEQGLDILFINPALLLSEPLRLSLILGLHCLLILLEALRSPQFLSLLRL